MAMNPNILLSYQPPVVKTPQERAMEELEMQTKQLSLQNLLNQQQMLPYQMQTAQNQAEMQAMALEEAKREQADQKAFSQAFKDLGGDLDAIEKNAAKYGISPESLMSFHQKRQAQAIQDAQLDVSTLAAKHAGFQRIQDIASTMQDPESTAAGIQMLVEEGRIPSAQAEKLMQQLDADPKAAAKIGQMFATHGLSYQQRAELALSNHKAVRDQAMFDVEYPGAMAKSLENLQNLGLSQEAAMKILSTASGGTKAGGASSVLGEIANAPQLSPDEWLSMVDEQVDPEKYPDLNVSTKSAVKRAFTLPGNKIENARKAIEQGKAQVDRMDVAKVTAESKADAALEASRTPVLTGIDYAERLQQIPEPDRSAVKALLEYRRTPVGGFATKDPYWKKMLNYAQQVDPSYDETTFKARQSLVNSYTSGRDKRELEAINTTAHHLDTVARSAAALKNGNIQMLNKIANEIGVQTGATGVTTLRNIVDLVGTEITRAYVGTGGEASERKEHAEMFSPNLAPQQLIANVGMTLDALEAKVHAKEHAWKVGMNRTDFSPAPGGPGFLQPETLEIFKKYDAPINRVYKLSELPKAAAGMVWVQKGGQAIAVPSRNLATAKERGYVEVK